jgi:hypothetical protein
VIDSETEINAAPPPVNSGWLDRVCIVLSVLVLLVFTLFLFWTLPLTGPLLSFPAAGAVIILFAARPTKAQLMWSMVIGIAYAGTYLQSHQFISEAFVGAPVVNAFAFWGVGSILVLGWRAVVHSPYLDYFLLSLAGPSLMILVRLALAVALPFQPQPFDLNLYAVDSRLGLPLWRVAAEALRSCRPLANACAFVYTALWLAQVLSMLLFLKGKRRMAANPFFTIPVAGVLGCVLYQICPASGPLYAFGNDFPHVTTSTARVVAGLAQAPRNAVPSLHAAWALLIFWSTKGYGAGLRWAAAVFLTLTLVATLGSGEHYLVDLIVGLVFAVFIQAVAERQWLWAALNAGVTLLCCVYLRLGWVSAINPWLLVALCALSSVSFLTRDLEWKPGRTTG